MLVVDSPDMVRRQTVPLGRRAPQAIGVLVGHGRAAGHRGGPAGRRRPAGGRRHGRCCGWSGVQEAYRAVSWQTVVLIGGLIPLSIAIQDSGAADLVAERIVDIVGDRGPYALMLALFVLTAVLGQIVSNTATVLIVVPIALSAAAETGVSRAAGADAGGGRRRRVAAHPDRHPGEHDGDGARRLPVRRLLEVRRWSPWWSGSASRCC